MAADLLLGVDIGTTALKAGLFDLEGRMLAVAEADYPVSRPQPNWAEQDPNIWLVALVDALDQLEPSARQRGVSAIGVCGQVNTHIFVDEMGEPLRPAILWQDQRCASIAADLNTRVGSDEAFPKGFALDASSLICRAEWVRREDPELWDRAAYVLSPKDYLTTRLCLLKTPITDPISPIGLVDATGNYNARALSLVEGLANRMPLLERFDAPIGVVMRPNLSLLQDAMVVAGTMDAWGNLYGSGVVEHGDAMEVAGTSEILGVLSSECEPIPSVVSFPPVDGLYLHAGPTQAGGAALGWLAELVGSSRDEVIGVAGGAPPGSGGLIFLPHLLGERAPLWDSDARGAFIGLSSEHGTPHLCRAVLEGVAYSARHLLEELEKAALLQPEILNSSGGGSRSDLWCQIKADVLERPMARMRVTHSGCLGAALMAASGARLVPSLKEAASRMAAVESVFEPRANRHIYDELYELYRQLYLDLQPIHSALAELRRHERAIATAQ
jgi:xylulokinase